jgi:hypothetical protein
LDDNIPELQGQGNTCREKIDSEGWNFKFLNTCQWLTSSMTCLRCICYPITLFGYHRHTTLQTAIKRLDETSPHEPW